MIVLFAVDIQVLAAIAGIATATVAAVAAITRIGVKFFSRRPPRLTVHARETSADRQGRERYITVFAAHAGPRPITVVEMGLRLDDGERVWRLTDGATNRDLPAELQDGAIISMTWLRDELGHEFYSGNATIKECFAVDSYGREARGRPPK